MGWWGGDPRVPRPESQAGAEPCSPGSCTHTPGPPTFPRLLPVHFKVGAPSRAEEVGPSDRAKPLDVFLKETSALGSGALAAPPGQSCSCPSSLPPCPPPPCPQRSEPPAVPPACLPPARSEPLTVPPGHRPLRYHPAELPQGGRPVQGQEVRGGQWWGAGGPRGAGERGREGAGPWTVLGPLGVGGCPTGRTLVERGRGHRSQHPHPLVLSRGGQTLLWLASGSLCP